MSVSRRRFLELSAAASALAMVQTSGLPAFAAEVGGPDKWVQSVCRYCGTGCGVMVGVKKGKVVAVKGDTENHNQGLLCMKSAYFPEVMNAPDRLLYPLIRTNGKLQRATWDDAMALVAGRFKETVEKHGPDAVAFYGSGQALTEETYVANKLFKAGIRTNNMDGNPRLCMASAVAGYVSTYGKDEPMGCYEDIDAADVFFIIGSNTAEAHPILFQRISRRKRQKSSVKVIVLDPRRTETCRIADLHLSFAPGTDLAILNAMANVIIKEGLIDQEFIKDNVAFGEGTDVNKSFEDYKAFVAAYTPEKAAEISGCPADDIVRAARMFAEAHRATMSMWTMGLNQRTRGVWVNNLVHNLHLITGKIGKPGSTPFSLTGQPNACGGVRDGGGLSHLLPYGRVIANEKHREEIEKAWGVPKGTIQAKPGLATVDMFRALEDRKIKAMYVMCTNPGQSLPSVDRFRKAMSADDTFLVVSEAFHPTRTTELADVVLPSALWAEKEGVYGCTERRYQLLNKAVEPQGEARPDFQILCDLARRLGHADLVKWTRMEEVWQELQALSKGTAYDFTGMTRSRLRASHGLLWPMPSETHPGTKRRYVKGEDPLVAADWPKPIRFYGRPDNKAVVWLRPQQPPAEVPDTEYPFYFTTGRVLQHWHTGTMTRNCKSLQASYEAVAELNPDDAKSLKLKTGDQVRISSRRGQQQFQVKVTDASRRGLVFAHMHDQDHMCNRLTIDAVDPVSKEPEYKICAVKLERV
ncbi:MAG: molybdopterin oxidoreductase family protein [Terriglobales bacterium]